MSLDFSAKPELRALAGVVRDLDRVAAPAACAHLLIGAGARDLMLQHAYGLPAQRATEDVDFAVMVEDWTAFESLRTRLLESGGFEERGGRAIHKLRHRATRLPLDIVPFGGVERADRSLAWPPENDPVYDCFGLREALDASVQVQLPDGVPVRVATLPALTVLKLTAWRDRKHTHPKKDAGDLFLYLKHYLNCGNRERLESDHADILNAEDFDFEPAGARLLGRDIRALLGPQGADTLLALVRPELDIDGQQLLVGQSGIEVNLSMQLLVQFSLGLSEGR